MSNSPLVEYVKISPYKTSPRTNTIKKITIHHMAGNLSIERCGNVFQSSNTSSNYGIDSEGRVGMYVEEKDRAWCTSSGENDHQAINIEVANDEIGGNWHVSDKALAKLIDLCVDICRRNGIKELIYTGDTKGNLTMHCWFKNTTCPGPYLKSKYPYIAEQVNKRLISQNYLVRVTADELNYRSGPSVDYKILGTIKDSGVYTIIQEKNGWGQLKSKVGWINLKYTKRL